MDFAPVCRISLHTAGADLLFDLILFLGYRHFFITYVVADGEFNYLNFFPSGLTYHCLFRVFFSDSVKGFQEEPWHICSYTGEYM